MYLNVKSVLHNKWGRGAAPQTHVGLGVCDQTRSERHDEPGSDLTALFTVMHSSVSFLKLERFCLTCTSGQQVDLSLCVWNDRRASLLCIFASSVLTSKPKAKSNQTHTETPANTNCTMYSVEAQSEGLPYALFFGLYYPHEYTHYSKYSKFSWM